MSAINLTIAFFVFVCVVIGGYAVFSALRFAMRRMMLYIYYHGGFLRHRLGAKPWKGYKRIHSFEWNEEHTK